MNISMQKKPPIGKFPARAVRFFKKALRGEDVLLVAQPEEKWDAQFRQGSWCHLSHAPNTLFIAGWIMRRAREASGRLRVLDVGCGDGELAAALASEVVEYWGTDISQEALAQAREKHPDGTFLHASMEEAPPVEGKFDVVVFNEVLYYAPPRKVLVRHRAALNERGGRVIVSLYQSWRAPFLWRSVRGCIQMHEHVRICHRERRHCWRIAIGSYAPPPQEGS